MNQLDSINRISSLLARFVAEVKGLNSINQYGINYLSETVLVPIFKEIYGYENLINLNRNEDDVAGIDLGDKNAKVAFQITSTAANSKVISTVNQFLKQNYADTYSELYVYIITEKQLKYSEDFSSLTEGKFSFNKNNIHDYRDLLKLINSIDDLEKVKRIELLLERQFTDPKLEEYKERITDVQTTETIYTNLVEITFPSNIFVAKLILERKQIIKENKLRHDSTDRDIVFAYKKQKELKFGADWVVNQGFLVTFEDLRKKKNDLHKIVEMGTLSEELTEDYYTQNSDIERVFKDLLKKCFSRQVYNMGIDWVYDEKLYIYKPQNENTITRTETWVSSKINSRDVIRIKLHKDEPKPWYYTHLAFSISFKRFENAWFMLVEPDYFISKDGQKKHYYMSEGVKTFLKRKDRNQHVFNHIKFIVHQLKYKNSQSDLFSSSYRAGYIDFGKFATFENQSPILVENEWLRNEEKEVLTEMADKGEPVILPR